MDRTNTQPQNKTNGGYAILFTILLVSIILGITMGIANVAIKELNFSATATNSHISFFGADTAGECALFAVRKKNLTTGGSTALTCGSEINNQLSSEVLSPDPQSTTSGGITRYNYDNLQVQDGCASVNVIVDSNTQITDINAYGYNVLCSGMSSATKVERSLSYELDGGGGTTTSGTNGSGGNSGGTYIQGNSGGTMFGTGIVPNTTTSGSATGNIQLTSTSTSAG